MCKSTLKILIQISILILFSAAASYGQLLGTACEPYGSVSIKNEPAADNVPVVAFINNSEIARCLTQDGQYSLFIAKDNPDTPEKDGWVEGENIVIKINGIEANPSFEAQSGRIRIDLSVNTSGIKLDTWGKIKALFK